MSDFTGFGPGLIQFLEDLRFHNERSWFEANKGRYERDVREPALAFVRAMAPHLAAISPELVADDRKAGGSLMRIHRDVRFSKDPSPYKTNLGIQFRHRAGKDVHAPGLYLHVEPGECFLAAGLWHPEPDVLRAIRTAVAEQPTAWVAARDDAGFAKRWRLAGDSLKRPPRGFDPDHPEIEDIKRTDFIAVTDLPEADLTRPDLAQRTAGAYAATTPLMTFLCGAVGAAY
jgi:uncharacterized protein (TIGR02453 family)